MFFAIYAYFCYNGQKITILHLGVVDPNYHNITILGAGRGDYTIYGWPLTRRQQGKRHQLWFMMKVWMWQMKSTTMHSSLRRPDIQTERERVPDMSVTHVSPLCPCDGCTVQTNNDLMKHVQSLPLFAKHKTSSMSAAIWATFGFGLIRTEFCKSLKSKA